MLSRPACRLNNHLNTLMCLAKKARRSARAVEKTKSGTLLEQNLTSFSFSSGFLHSGIVYLEIL